MVDLPRSEERATSVTGAWCPPARVPFDPDLDFDAIDFRAHPEWYRIGRGEQGVLSVRPYKDELLPLWRFRTPEIAAQSAGALFTHYLHYRDEEDFVGMDMARKFIQMGYTRARRYANWKGGRKHAPDPAPGDPAKAESAAVFKPLWDEIRRDPLYAAAKARHRRLHERASPTSAGAPRRKAAWS